MLESFRGNNFTYEKISPEEQQRRGILGRLVGVIADTVNPTRNGRKYGASLWDKVFSDPIVQEKIQNRVFFGELEHPVDDRESIDPEKIAICLAEVPKKNDQGQLVGVFDVVDTPCGRILKTMLDYGTTIGVSSRGSGDLYTDYDGQEAVDPDTYQCFTFDAVTVPSVKAARLQMVNESLEHNGKTLKEALQKLVESADDADKAVMQKTIDDILDKKDEPNKEDAKDTEKDDAEVPEDTKKVEKNEKPMKATVKEDKSDKHPKQDLDVNHIMSLSKDDDSSIDKTPQGCVINLRGKDLKNEKLIDYLDSLSCAVLDDSVTSKTVRSYKCRCKFDFLGESLENLSGKTVTVIYNDEDGEQKETHFECDKNYDINGKQIRAAIKASDRDIKEIVNIHESLDKDEVNSLCDKILMAIDEKTSLSVEDFNAVVKCLYKAMSPENEDEEEYEFFDPLQKVEDDDTSLVTEALIYPELYGEDMTFVVNNALSSQIKRLFGSRIKDKQILEKNKIQFTIPYDSDLEQLARKTHSIARQIYKQDEEEVNNTSKEVDNVKADDSDIIEELQETLQKKHDLESKVVGLQEKLSVCYAKEGMLEEQLSKYKKAVRNLTTKANMVPALTERVSKLSEDLENANNSLQNQLANYTQLQEELKSSRVKAKNLNESINSKAQELSSINESFQLKENALNETIQQLNETLENERETFNKKLDVTTKAVEKYKKIANNAVNKYVESKAVQIGVNVNEIKNKLPESYNFEDINKICEDLQQQKMNLNKLPFRTSNLNENVKVSVKTTCKPDNILPKENPTTDDSIDSWLGQFLGR